MVVSQSSVFHQIIYMKYNAYSWDKSASEVDSGVTQVDLTDQDGNPLEFGELTSPLIVNMPQQVKQQRALI